MGQIPIQNTNVCNNPTPTPDSKVIANSFISGLTRMKSHGIFFPEYVKLDGIDVFTLVIPSNIPNAPTLIYNPGGPGASGIMHIFIEYTPYVFDIRSGTWKRNSGVKDISSWANLIYVDAPGNTGYSIVTGSLPYNDQTSTSIFTETIETLLDHYGWNKNPIDFFGFSYAGKIWPLVAQQMLLDGYNIHALVIFSGYTDPVRQEVAPLLEYVSEIGGLSNKTYKDLQPLSNEIQSLLSGKVTQQSLDKAQQLYFQMMPEAWGDTELVPHNIRMTARSIAEQGGGTVENTDDDAFIDVGEILPTPEIEESNKEEEISLLNLSAVKEIFGVNTHWNAGATSFTIPGYQGFLSSSISALKFLGQKGVIILYFMGSFDGATIAKGTKDMLESTFGPLDEYVWVDKAANNPSEAINTTIYGKIGQVQNPLYPHVYYGVAYDTGHSFDGPKGEIAFEIVMGYLRSGIVSNPVLDAPKI